MSLNSVGRYFSTQGVEIDVDVVGFVDAGANVVVVVVVVVNVVVVNVVVIFIYLLLVHYVVCYKYYFLYVI